MRDDNVEPWFGRDHLTFLLWKNKGNTVPLRKYSYRF